MAKTTQCPVCGMETEEEYAFSTHDGKVYSFCSEMCRESFEKDPDRFVKSEEHKSEEHKSEEHKSEEHKSEEHKEHS